MDNPVKKVDDFFALFVDDEAGRFFFLHVPFWGLVIFIGWHVMESLGLFLLWGAFVFAAVPYVIANVYLGIYEQDRFEHYEGKLTMFRVALTAYAASILALIGVPGWYFGFILQAAQTKVFEGAYWAVVVFWWELFNFYHGYTKKAAQEFVNGFVFQFQTWQWSFLVSAVVITPILFYRLYAKAKERTRDEELDQIRHEREAKERIEQAQAKAQELEKRRQLNEKKRLEEERIESEKQKKIQEKINEVKGKDPWDSGFL